MGAAQPIQMVAPLRAADLPEFLFETGLHAHADYVERCHLPLPSVTAKDCGGSDGSGYLLSTALRTSLTPMAPTKRDWSSNSATGAVCERCMASMTVFSEVPGRAQKTCGASSGSFSMSSQEIQTEGCPWRSAATTSPCSSILKRVVCRRSSQSQPSPADS